MGRVRNTVTHKNRDDDVAPILVTGGAGFLGSHVVDLLLAEGRRVVVLDNLSTGKRENLRPEVPFYLVDIASNQASALIHRFRPRHIVHLAAQVSVARSVADPIEDVRANVLGTVNLLAAAAEVGTTKVVFASSGGAIYGEADSFPTAEESLLSPVSPYGIAKASCEQYLRFFNKEHGICYDSLRFGNIYGPRQDPNGEAGVVAIFIGKMLRGEQPVINGDGCYVRDYVYVGDAARAVLLALAHEGSGAYNVATGQGVDVNTLFSLLATITGFKASPCYGPPRPGDLRTSILDYTRAYRNLGWEPRVTLEEGLGYTLEYFQRQLVG